MGTSIKTDDLIFNFFKQICDESDDKKCIALGNSWIEAMEKNLEQYKPKEDDNLWRKISKTYMREGLRRLVRKRKIKTKNLPSMKRKKSKR